MLPTVSIIIPCYNEKRRIHFLLDALYAQTYPRERMEVVIADGISTDGTREEIAAWSASHADLQLKIVDNDKRSIPSALNRAIESACGEFIVRLDGHSGPYPEYVARAVSALEGGLGENVGGVWEIRPGAETWIAQSIAVAAAHPLGVGDALYRHATQSAYVDTVPFGAFRKRLWEQVGKFDETLLTNEDYEFNVRIRRSGGRVWLNPEIRSIYFARSSLSALAKQYWRYGYWKTVMLRRYPDTIRWRQALPPLFALTLAGGILLSWVNIIAFLLLLELIIYFFALILAGIQQSVKRKSPVYILGMPFAIATMHLAWGTAFLWSMISGGKIR